MIEPHRTLQRTLRFKIGIAGAKQMCGCGACGSCTAVIDGRAVKAEEAIAGKPINNESPQGRNPGSLRAGRGK